jgi:DNA polymerase III psi subunit
MPQKEKGMAEQITRDTEALKLFFTEDIFLVPNELLAAASLPAAETREQVKETASYASIGQNARKILILVQSEEYPTHIGMGIPLLWNIVKAIKLEPADVAVVNYSAYPDLQIEALQAYFQPQLLISFGIESKALGLSLQPLQVLVNLAKMNAIFSLSLKGLDEDINSKKMLWKSLQQLSLS